MTNQYLYLNAALNYRFTDNDYNNVVKYSISNKNHLDDVWKKKYFDKKSENLYIILMKGKNMNNMNTIRK